MVETETAMIHILESFACGLAFSMGAYLFFYIRDFATAKGRAEIRKDFQDHAARVEERLSIQVRTMAACLAAIEKQKP